MTVQQKLLSYLILAIASALFQWPAGILVLMIIADINGDIK